MKIRRIRFMLPFALLLACMVGLQGAADPSAGEPLDLAAIARLKDEGLKRSRVMEVASYLTDVYGPRLTGSPDVKEAADWTVKTLADFGMANVHIESWPFGRAWQNERVVARAVSPRTYPLIAYPKAWTPGTNGPVTAEATLAVIQNDRDFDRFRGTLRGRFVLALPLRQVPARFEPLGRRFTDGDLAGLAAPPAPRRNAGGNAQNAAAFNQRKTRFWVDEGVAAVLDFSAGDGGTLFVGSGGSRDPNAPQVPPQVTLAVEHYGRIARTLEKNIPVTLFMDIQNRFVDNVEGFNIIADLPGTDKADEIVMLGAHFDSWHTGTGATDNAAGSAVMLEAMRLLKATGVRLRRTVRLGLWTGEEQGFFGSRAYVKAHLGDPATMQLKPDHAKFSAYFNVDNGTGLIRGVYQQGNEVVAPIFSAWMAPLKDLGVSALTMRGTGGTDHVSFDAVGLPGFQFIQDPVEYDSRTHHSNMDVYERLQPEDMMRNAVIVATFAYNAANRDEPLPRKPLPRPQ
jgi:hypothetical protein